MGLGQDVNNQKKEMGEMALVAGQSYTDKNGTKVIQGVLTREQGEWLQENYNKFTDAITCLPLTPSQKLYIALCKNGMQLQEALASCDLNESEAAEARQALKIRDADGVVTEITRPTFVGADLWEADLWGAKLQGANLWGAQMQGADLYGADLEGAHLWGADLERADLSLTDLSGANFYNAKNLKSTKWDLAFYDATNPPINLPDNIKDKLLALDEPAYKTAKELQDAYREALVLDNETAITDAEKALTTHLEKCREENAKKAIQQTVSEAVHVFGAAETLTTVLMAIASAKSAVTITGESATTAAVPSDQQDVSLGAGNVDPYIKYGYPALQR